MCSKAQDLHLWLQYSASSAKDYAKWFEDSKDFEGEAHIVQLGKNISVLAKTKENKALVYLEEAPVSKALGRAEWISLLNFFNHLEACGFSVSSVISSKSSEPDCAIGAGNGALFFYSKAEEKILLNNLRKYISSGFVENYQVIHRRQMLGVVLILNKGINPKEFKSLIRLLESQPEKSKMPI